MPNKYGLLMDYYQNFIKKFAHMAKPLNTLTWHDAKSTWTLMHQTTCDSLKGAPIQAPILHFLDPLKEYIVFTNASDDACGAQMSQEEDGQELPAMLLPYTFAEIQ